jgi:hypothetical protein
LCANSPFGIFVVRLRDDDAHREHLSLGIAFHDLLRVFGNTAGQRRDALKALIILRLEGSKFGA